MKLIRTYSLCLISFFSLSFTYGQERSSDNFSMLKSIHDKHPGIDSNNDGVLTETEYRVNQNKRFFRKPESNLSGYYNYIANIPYVNDGNKAHELDIIIPENKAKGKLPAIIFIHGGGWKGGTKNTGLKVLDPVLKSGKFIGVSINYRLSGEAKWPTQIQDCNAAIRWIKANADKYNIDKEKLCVWGTSAGGHLVTMLALTPNNKTFQGELGEHLDESSEITCAIDGFGPTDFLMEGTYLHELVNNKLQGANKDNMYNLLGGIEEQAENVSPIHWVNSKAKPLFIYHGTIDTTVDIKHSVTLKDSLNQVGFKDVYLTRVKNLEHELTFNAEMLDRVLKFCDKYLYDKKIDMVDDLTVDK